MQARKQWLELLDPKQPSKIVCVITSLRVKIGCFVGRLMSRSVLVVHCTILTEQQQRCLGMAGHRNANSLYLGLAGHRIRADLETMSQSQILIRTQILFYFLCYPSCLRQWGCDKTANSKTRSGALAPSQTLQLIVNLLLYRRGAVDSKITRSYAILDVPVPIKPTKAG